MTVLVKHIMSKRVVSLFAEQTLPLAEDVMRFKHVRHLPVIDERNRLVGIVSDRDILAAQISSLTTISASDRRELHEHTQVSQIMTTDVWTAGADMTAANAAQLLLEHRFSCLPVVDEAGLLIGIVTERDLVRLAVAALADGNLVNSQAHSRSGR